MGAREMLDKRLWRRQTDQSGRVEFGTWAWRRGTILDAPRRRCVNGKDRDFAVFHRKDRIFERVSHLAREAETW